MVKEVKQVVQGVKSTVNQAIAFTKSGEAKQTLSIIVDFIPFIGNGKAAFESAYGYNPITKEEFSTVDRAIGVAGIVFGGLGKVVRKCGGVTIDAVIDAVSTDKKITNAAVETSKKNKKIENENTKGTGKDNKSDVNIDNFDFGKYLKTNVGDPPKGMKDPHAHHILFKKGLGKSQQELVKEGYKILREYDIDPIFGIENLTWATNRVKGQHGIDALKNVVDNIKEIKNSGGDRDDMVQRLKELGDLAATRR